MAQPIRHIRKLQVSEESKRERDITEIIAALSENKEAVMEGIELLHRLHERGMLTLCNGLLAEGDKVLSIVVKELNKPQNAKVLSNMAELVLLLGSLDVERLKPIIQGAQAGLEAATEAAVAETSEKTGLFDLLKALKDPDISRAISMMLNFLKGMGRAMPESSD